LSKVEVEINGMKFTPMGGSPYKFDYCRIYQDVVSKRHDERQAYRSLILNDLFFITYFVMRIPVANHPFWVQACREVEDGPKDYTLDVWAREHGKSSIITIAETIQYLLANPDMTCGIFSYVRPVAKKFLFSVKETLQNEKILHYCFPDVLYENHKDAPLWSLDEGLILKRQTKRKEPSISAWGLVEGMPTGMHFERRIYDDIVTEDIAESVDMMEKVKNKFDSSQNIGTDQGHHRVIGTYYHHNDPLTYVRGKRDFDDKPKYYYRFKPATADGTATGVPVFLSQGRLDDLRLTRSFNCQQLLDPSPVADASLHPDYMTKVEKKLIPKELVRMLLVDQAGDYETNIHQRKADSWAVGVIGVEPVSDEIGQSNIYIEDLWISPANESEAIEQIVRMYLKARMIHRLGVEKVGISTTHNQIQRALRAYGRYISFDRGGNGILLRPAGRNKRKFIESSISWPLNNGKIFYSDAVPPPYLDRLKMEMRNFPAWHDDGLNMLSYVYDVIKDEFFPAAEDIAEQNRRKRYEEKPVQRGWMAM